LLLEGGIVKGEKLDALLKEAQELTSIFVASLCTAKGIVAWKGPSGTGFTSSF
jgi:hypothetical protein